uniref:Uncharacterized protein n=1 Tax=Meloidogyne floridensis TaxID=298350 RepID=A0A915P998_9BILA
MYGKRRIPCCDIFRPTYVMLRGRCYRMRAFAQTEPDEAGKLTLFFKEMSSSYLARQLIVYLSQQYEDIPTFPRFYLNNNYWYRLRLKKKHISLLNPNQHCSPVEKYIKRGNCYVDSCERIIQPFNCTIFYFSHKNPKFDVCDPEIIFNNYFSIMNVVDNLSVYQSISKCLPKCERDIIDTQLFSNKFQDQRSNVGAKNKKFHFHLEASYENLQEEVYEEKLTTTLPGFISQIGGQFSFFLGMSLISLLQFFLIPIINFIGKLVLKIKTFLFSTKKEDCQDVQMIFYKTYFDEMISQH